MREQEQLRYLLNGFSKKELTSMAGALELPVSGAKPNLIGRVLRHYDYDFDELVSRRGPCYRDEWNDLVQHFGGTRRRSYEDIRVEFQLILARARAARFSVEELLELRVGDIRREAFEDALAEKLGLESRSVRKALKTAHHRTKVAKALGELVAPKTGGFGEPTGSGSTEKPKAGIAGGELVRGRYRKLQEIGSGGFGITYEAEDLENPVRGRIVLKFSHDENKDASLEREIRAVHDLTHRNICRYFDYATDEEGRPFLVMEYGGRSLEVLIRDERAWDLDDALRIIEQVGRALDYAHSREVVHGDVNPGNILVDEDDVARLTDFGISAALVKRALTRGGYTMQATSFTGLHPTYSAPEVFLEHTSYRASDQYSLALVFCSMLDGQVLRGIYMRRNYKRLSRSQNKALTRALDREHSRRFDTCAEFLEALRD